MMMAAPAELSQPVHQEIDGEAWSKGRSPHTRRAYRRWIGVYIQDKLPGITVDWRHINVDQVAPLLTQLEFSTWLGQLKARNLGKQSLDQARAAILWLSRCIAETYPDPEQNFDVIFSRLASVKTPNAEKGQRQGTWLDSAQTSQLIKAAMPSKKAPSATELRNMALVTLLTLCALRRDEAAKACWSDLDERGGNTILHVHGKGSKHREVKVPEEALKTLLRWKTCQQKVVSTEVMFTRIRRGDHVTADKLTPQAVMDVVQKIAKKAELPSISPHDLRRTFARGAYEAGASFELIRQTLGHAHVNTTEHYINATQELNHAATDIVAEAFRKSAETKGARIPSEKTHRFATPISPASDENSDAARRALAEKDLLTREEAASYLGISVSQFDRMKKEMKLKPVQNAQGPSITNAKTRPFQLYRRTEVDTLKSLVARIRGHQLTGKSCPLSD